MKKIIAITTTFIALALFTPQASAWKCEFHPEQPTCTTTTAPTTVPPSTTSTTTTTTPPSTTTTTSTTVPPTTTTTTPPSEPPTVIRLAG